MAPTCSACLESFSIHPNSRCPWLHGTTLNRWLGQPSTTTLNLLAQIPMSQLIRASSQNGYGSNQSITILFCPVSHFEHMLLRRSKIMLFLSIMRIDLKHCTPIMQCCCEILVGSDNLQPFTNVAGCGFGGGVGFGLVFAYIDFSFRFAFDFVFECFFFRFGFSFPCFLAFA